MLKMTSLSGSRSRQRGFLTPFVDPTEGSNLLFGEQSRETVDRRKEWEHHSVITDPFAVYDKKDIERLNNVETKKPSYNLSVLKSVSYTGPEVAQGDRKVSLSHTTIKVSSCNGYRTTPVKCKTSTDRRTKVTPSRVTRM